jgi:hypothetical protein
VSGPAPYCKAQIMLVRHSHVLPTPLHSQGLWTYGYGADGATAHDGRTAAHGRAAPANGWAGPDGRAWRARPDAWATWWAGLPARAAAYVTVAVWQLQPGLFCASEMVSLSSVVC